ncbi:MAG: hypothetical protein K9G64_02110 [Bacteroidia bacterium]|jgi:hypothetical protein|nr:hypothetical protein [Bacteroidia bacterium]
MDNQLIGVIFIIIGIGVLLLVIYKPPKSEYPGMPTLQGIMSFIIFIIMGVLLLMGKIKF